MIKTLNYKLQSCIKTFLFDLEKRRKRKEILYYFAKNPPQEKETEAAIAYLKNHSLSNFYGDFQEKYRADSVQVYSDSETGLKYIVENNKRLYLKKSHNKRTAQLIYNQLRIEQDSQSPHCYTDKTFVVTDKTILADVGCAEGYFSFQHIETVKKVYLFEQDPEWIEALEATFKPWKEKVVIVRKFVSDKIGENEIMLDTFFENRSNRPNFYKIDVEGAEESVLKGMKSLLQKPPLQIALCTYHNGEDFEKFSDFFSKNDISFYRNPGLMIFAHDLKNLQPPYFRTCLIKATKNE